MLRLVVETLLRLHGYPELVTRANYPEFAGWILSAYEDGVRINFQPEAFLSREAAEQEVANALQAYVQTLKPYLQAHYYARETEDGVDQWVDVRTRPKGSKRIPLQKFYSLTEVENLLRSFDVAIEGRRVVLTQDGKPVCALVPIADYELLERLSGRKEE